MDVHQRSISAYETAAAGNRGRQGTLVRLAWLYLNVDPRRVPVNHIAQGRELVVEAIADAIKECVRDHCRRLAAWLSDHWRGLPA